ncbi:MAG: chain-length determining protein, partial [Brevundimonas sp.]
MRSSLQAPVRPRYGLLDVVGLLLRETILMIVVFVVIFALGAAAVLTVMKKSYTATASVFAGVGQEYVYQPRVGTSERGQAPTADEVSQSEAAILGSTEVKQRVIEALGPRLFQGSQPSTKSQPEQVQDAMKVL